MASVAPSHDDAGRGDDEQLGFVGEIGQDVEHGQLPFVMDDGAAVAAGSAGLDAVGVPTASTSQRPSRRVRWRS